MSDETKTRTKTKIERPHMEPQGVSYGDQGVYVGSLMGYQKYVLYTVKGGAFTPITTIDTLEEAERVAGALMSAADIGAAAAVYERTKKEVSGD